MSWLSKATGIHWGNIAKPISQALKFVPIIGGPLSAAVDAGDKLFNSPGAKKVGSVTSPAPPTGASSTGSSTVGNIFSNPDGSIDWQKIADAGLTGLDAYNAAMNAQKQGSLLNTGVSNYNNNWTQGKNILMKPHPVDLSADFAGSDNPFARTSVGAIPGGTAPPPMLPNLPPLPGNAVAGLPNPVAQIPGQSAIGNILASLPQKKVLGAVPRTAARAPNVDPLRNSLTSMA